MTFENVVLRKMLDRRKTMSNSKNTYEEDLHNVYSAINVISVQIKEDEMGGACSTHGTDEKS
jgi:hypothetical protein